jgi:hypothetical protein
MSSSYVRTTFETALSVAYPTMRVVSVRNTVVDPPRDAGGKLVPFLGVFYLATEDALGLGGKDWREEGTINVLIYALAGRGDFSFVADEIRNLFAGRVLPVAPPGVRLGLLNANPLTGFLGSAQVASGVYDVGMVAIQYQFDFQR